VSAIGTLIAIVKQLLLSLWVVPRELLLLVWLLLKTIAEVLVIAYNALAKFFREDGRPG